MLTSFSTLTPENFTLEGNQMVDRVSGAICALRNQSLEEFVVDCPTVINSVITGLICGIPTCCTACRKSS